MLTLRATENFSSTHEEYSNGNVKVYKDIIDEGVRLKSSISEKTFTYKKEDILFKIEVPAFFKGVSVTSMFVFTKDWFIVHSKYAELIGRSEVNKIYYYAVKIEELRNREASVLTEFTEMIGNTDYERFGIIEELINFILSEEKTEEMFKNMIRMPAYARTIVTSFFKVKTISHEVIVSCLPTIETSVILNKGRIMISGSHAESLLDRQYCIMSLNTPSAVRLHLSSKINSVYLCRDYMTVSNRNNTNNTERLTTSVATRIGIVLTPEFSPCLMDKDSFALLMRRALDFDTINFDFSETISVSQITDSLRQHFLTYNNLRNLHDEEFLFHNIDAFIGRKLKLVTYDGDSAGYVIDPGNGELYWNIDIQSSNQVISASEVEEAIGEDYDDIDVVNSLFVTDSSYLNPICYLFGLLTVSSEDINTLRRMAVSGIWSHFSEVY